MPIPTYWCTRCGSHDRLHPCTKPNNTDCPRPACRAYGTTCLYNDQCTKETAA